MPLRSAIKNYIKNVAKDTARKMADPTVARFLVGAGAGAAAPQGLNRAIYGEDYKDRIGGRARLAQSTLMGSLGGAFAANPKAFIRNTFLKYPEAGLTHRMINRHLAQIRWKHKPFNTLVWKNNLPSAENISITRPLMMGGLISGTYGLPIALLGNTNPVSLVQSIAEKLAEPYDPETREAFGTPPDATYLESVKDIVAETMKEFLKRTTKDVRDSTIEESKKYLSNEFLPHIGPASALVGIPLGAGLAGGLAGRVIGRNLGDYLWDYNAEKDPYKDVKRKKRNKMLLNTALTLGGAGLGAGLGHFASVPIAKKIYPELG